jgi:long-chain acyl-CoA synthetase
MYSLAALFLAVFLIAMNGTNHSTPTPVWHLTLVDALDRVARERSDALALTDARRSLSWAKLAYESSRFAYVLADRGVAWGDRVALLLENRVELPALIYACWRLGAVPVSLGVGPDGQVAAALALSNARALVCSRLSKDLAMSSSDAPCLDLDDDHQLHGSTTLSTEPAPGADALLLFTSGSTATPKGVRVSHEAMVRSAEFQRRYLAVDGARDRTALFLPLSRRMGLNAIFAHLAAGAEVAIVPPRDFAVAAMTGVTGLSLAPAHFQVLIDRQLLGSDQLPELRYIRVGAGRLDRTAAIRLQAERPGLEVMGTYGMTESGEITLLAGDALHGEPDSVGHPVEDVRVVIVGPDGASLPNGEVGEIAIVSPRLMIGYLGEEPRDREAPFRTGDRGAIHRDGSLRFVGRKEDHIKLSLGLSIELGGLADWLARVEGVKEVVAIGAPDAQLGEAAYVFAVPVSPETFDVETLWAAARSYLPPFALPREIRLLAELPLSTSGKVDRRALGEMISKKQMS